MLWANRERRSTWLDAFLARSELYGVNWWRGLEDVMTRYRLLVTVALGAVGACSRAPARHLLRLKARDLRFAPPAQVEAGVTRLRLIIRDPVWHEASLVRFTDSTSTLEAYMASARAGDECPAFAEDIGGVSALASGDSTDVLLNLEPGRYAVIGWHRDHLLQRMAAFLEAVGDDSPSVYPIGAVDIDLSDFPVPAFSPDLGVVLPQGSVG